MHKHYTCHDPGIPGITHPQAYEWLVEVVPSRKALAPRERGIFEEPTCVCWPGEIAVELFPDRQWGQGEFKDFIIELNP